MIIEENGAKVVFDVVKDEVVNPEYSESRAEYEDDYDVEENIEVYYWYIASVYTPKELRGQGIATRLIKKAVEEMTKLDSSLEIKLSCCPTDQVTEISRLCEFYEKLGFEADEENLGGEIVMTYMR